MGSLFKPPKMPETKLPEPYVPPIPEKEEGKDLERFMRKRRGREQTVMAGDLEPTDIGMKRLLG